MQRVLRKGLTVRDTVQSRTFHLDVYELERDHSPHSLPRGYEHIRVSRLHRERNCVVPPAQTFLHVSHKTVRVRSAYAGSKTM